MSPGAVEPLALLALGGRIAQARARWPQLAADARALVVEARTRVDEATALNAEALLARRRAQELGDGDQDPKSNRTTL